MSGGTQSAGPNYSGMALPQQITKSYGQALDTAGQSGQTAQGILGQMSPYLNQAGDVYGRMTGYAPGDISAGQLSNTNLSPYMNPYTQNVMDASINRLNQQEALEQRGLADQAQNQNAFGGDRQAIQQAAMNKNFDQTRAETIANLYNQNFMQAQNAAQQDISGRFGADSANQRMRGDMFSGGAQGLAGLGSTFGQLGGQLGQNAAGQLGDLSKQGYGYHQGLTGQMSGIGGQLQGLQQSIMDAAKGQYTGYTNAPSSGLEYFMRGLGAMPQGIGTTTQKTPAPPKSPLSGIGAVAPLIGK